MQLPRLIALALLVILTALGGYGWYLSRPVFDTKLADSTNSHFEVAPLKEAITFARKSSGEWMLVVEASAEGVMAVDLSQSLGADYSDVATLYRVVGADTLTRIAESQDAHMVEWRALGVPVPLRAKSIAAGTNYSAHAQEVGLDAQPFVFPKLSLPTAWNADVLPGGRLDHEVELCALTLDEHNLGDQTPLAFFLCGDFTDRWLLVRDLDLDGDMGKTGFPSSKGGPSRMPVGALIVIPRSATFYESLDLELYVNGAMRQQSSAKKMLWSPLQILDEALEDCHSTYINGVQEISVVDNCNRLPVATIVLTGTPEGTMFNLITLWNRWFYLSSGDVVVSKGKHLGFTRNTIR